MTGPITWNALNNPVNFVYLSFAEISMIKRRLAFIFGGDGRGAQIGKTSLLEVECITAQASTFGVLLYLVRFRPWDPTKTLDLGKKKKHVLTM